LSFTWAVQLHADIGRYIPSPETPAGIFVYCVLIALPTSLGPSRVRVADVDSEEFGEPPRDSRTDSGN